ncbi:aldose epimerase family protein [Verrucomicrobiota bacterium]
MAVAKEAFGKNMFGEDVELFTLTNRAGLKARIMNYGGIIVSLEVPDRDGNLADVVLGHDSAEEYTQATPYLGAAIGRFGNRIKDGKFTLEGKEYTLAVNNGPNALHGGLRGFDKRVWNAEILDAGNAVRMTYLSPDGEEGFPGEVKTVMTYTLTEANELTIDYEAESTAATPFNITNHSYFNLAGNNSGYVGAQVVMINADGFLPINDTGIPYGEVKAVAGTPFDFLEPTSIGARIEEEDEQIKFGSGYDHNFCLNKAVEGELSMAARATDLKSGRVMEIYTTEPGVQFYTANYLDLKGKAGCTYSRRCGFCLETQHYPDSPNQPQFPNTILQPGEKFVSQTVHRFSVA